jgi:hypothetical protein
MSIGFAAPRILLLVHMAQTQDGFPKEAARYTLRYTRKGSRRKGFGIKTKE